MTKSLLINRLIKPRLTCISCLKRVTVKVSVPEVFTQGFLREQFWSPVWLRSEKPLKIPRSPCPCSSALACRLTHPPPMCSVFVVCKVRSHLAALKSSGSVASSNTAATAPPAVSRSQSFSEPLAPSFENLHLRNSQEPHQHHHPPSSSPSSSSSSTTPARTDPQPHPKPRPSPHELAPSEEVPPRVRTGRKTPGVVWQLVFC